MKDKIPAGTRLFFGVEGRDAVGFWSEACRRWNLLDVYVGDVGGISEIQRRLGDWMKTEGFEAVTAVVVGRDVESEKDATAKGAWNLDHHALRGYRDLLSAR